jgi:hypothetical protein
MSIQATELRSEGRSRGKPPHRGPEEEVEMRKIVAIENVSLDGVMQAPGRPDEDLRGGFIHGGWAISVQRSGERAQRGGRDGRSGRLLFGRRTYEDFYGVWPGRRDNPFSGVLR